MGCLSVLLTISLLGCSSVLGIHWGPSSVRLSICPPTHRLSMWLSVRPSGCPLGIPLDQPRPGDTLCITVAPGLVRGSPATAVPLGVPRPSSPGAGLAATCWSAAGPRSWRRPSGTASGAARPGWRWWWTARSHRRCCRWVPWGGEGTWVPPRGSVTPCLHPTGAGPQAQLAGGQPRGGRGGRSERGDGRPLQGKGLGTGWGCCGGPEGMGAAGK